MDHIAKTKKLKSGTWIFFRQKDSLKKKIKLALANTLTYYPNHAIFNYKTWAQFSVFIKDLLIKYVI